MAKMEPVVSSLTSASGPRRVKYKAGDVIVTADPFVHVLNPEVRGTRCDNCLLKKNQLKRCAGCSLFCYCDRKCQLIDWKTYHRNGECDFFSKLMASGKKEVVNLFEWNHYAAVLLRLFLLITAKPDLMRQMYPLHDGRQRCLNDLMDDEHDEDRSGMNPLKFHLIFNAMAQVDDKVVELCRFGLLKSLFHKLRINSFSIDHMDEKTSVVGHGMYIQTSVFDHSCRSNAAYVFQGKRMQVRAMRDIYEGEEVTIHYIDLMATRAERQEKLWKNWGFHCQCERCTATESEEEKREIAMDQEYHTSILPANLSKMSESERNDVIFRGLVRVLPIKEKYLGRFHPHTTNLMYLAVNGKCSDACMSRDEMRDLETMIKKLEEASLVTHGKDDESYFMIPILRGTAGLSMQSLAND